MYNTFGTTDLHQGTNREWNMCMRTLPAVDLATARYGGQGSILCAQASGPARDHMPSSPIIQSNLDYPNFNYLNTCVI